MAQPYQIDPGELADLAGNPMMRHYLLCLRQRVDRMTEGAMQAFTAGKYREGLVLAGGADALRSILREMEVRNHEGRKEG